MENYFQNLDELVQGHLNQDAVVFHLDDLDQMVVAVEVTPPSAGQEPQGPEAAVEQAAPSWVSLMVAAAVAGF